MPFVSENSRHEPKFALHETAEGAVAYALEGQEKNNPDFWASNDGLSVVRGRGCYDHNIVVYESIEDALKAQLNLDPEAIASSLREIADAIDRFEAE